MKTKLFLTVFTYSLFFTGILSAENTENQAVFAPVGTKWYYNEIRSRYMNDTEIKDTTYILLESTETITVHDKLCSVITNVKGGMFCYDYPFNPNYTYQSNDTVFFYEENQFKPVYIWSAQANDSWKTLRGITVRVDSVKTVPILGQTMRAQHVTYMSNECDDCAFEFPAFIIENIGDLFYLYGFMVNGVLSCDEYMVNYDGLRCYTHPELGTYHHAGNFDCDYQTSAIKETVTEGLEIFENHIQLPDYMKEKAVKVNIFNSAGQCVLSANPDDDGKVSIENLPENIYIVSMEGVQSNVCKIFKIMK